MLINIVKKMIHLKVVKSNLNQYDYCQIRTKNLTILCSYFIFQIHQDCYCQIDFYGSSCKHIFYLIGNHQYINNNILFSHALYLGKEIYKAELTQQLSQVYIQS